MNLNKQIELAKALFGREEQTGVERVSAVAVADSSAGSVTVEFDDGTQIDVPVTGAVQSGDEVIVDIQDGAPIAAGAAGWGDRVQTIADSAATAANQAQVVANAVNQHFWHRSTDPNGDGAGTGAFITDEEQDDFLTAAAAGFSDYDPSTKPYRNVLMNSLGFLIREALHNLASFTQSAVAFFDGNGDVTATFGTSGAVIGRVANSESRTEISGDGMQVYRRDNGSDTMLASIGYGYGQDYPGGPSVQVPFYTFGTRASNSVVGRYSVAEGYNCTASAQCAHAEGGLTEASGMSAHTEGALTKASGSESHAQNHGTEAHANAQTTMGTFNVYDDSAPEPPIHPNGSYGYGTYALIVGNGIDDNNRSNAFTVAWNGDVAASGKVVNGSGDTLTGYKVTRFVPSSTSAQTLSTSAALLTSMGTKELDTAGVTVASNVFTVPEAGLWRITAQVGEYPASTAKTRMCVGIYDTSVSGTRWALGVQAVYNLTANTASQVVTIETSTVRQLAANAKVAIGVFADVANAKVLKSNAEITNITFEKVG